MQGRQQALELECELLDEGSGLVVAAVFKIGRTALLGRVSDRDAFGGFLRIIERATRTDPYDGELEPLPLGEELSGEWSLASPAGLEKSHPPLHWRFSQRLALALDDPAGHALAVVRPRRPVDAPAFASRVAQEIDEAFGAGACESSSMGSSPQAARGR